MTVSDHSAELRRYRCVLGFFIFALIMSGVTAFPLLAELRILARMLGEDSGAPAVVQGSMPMGLTPWVMHVRHGLERTYAEFPWIAYGTDWLAFGHVVIALFFVQPWRKPVGNEWVLKVGLVACAGVIPLALICGGVRGIPWAWRAIDCSFGLFGALPLLYCLRCVGRIRS